MMNIFVYNGAIKKTNKKDIINKTTSSVVKAGIQVGQDSNPNKDIVLMIDDLFVFCCEIIFRN